MDFREEIKVLKAKIAELEKLSSNACNCDVCTCEVEEVDSGMSDGELFAEVLLEYNSYTDKEVVDIFEKFLNDTSPMIRKRYYRS
jgi:hypothetical protein